MNITKEFSFDAAHRLYKVDKCHPCKNLHGHRYKVVISIHANSLNNGMILDYRSLYPFENWIKETFDHATLIAEGDKELLKVAEDNKSIFGKISVLPIEETTAELLASYIASKVISLLYPNVEGIDAMVFNITVCESPNTSATSDAEYKALSEISE